MGEGLEPPYPTSVSYPLYVRVNDSNGTLIIAAKRYSVTNAAVNDLNIDLRPNLRRKVINISGVSDHLMQDEQQEFRITSPNTT